MFLGALGFWLPDTFLHGVRAYKFSSWDVRIISAVMPLTFLGTYVAVKLACRGDRPRHLGLSMVAGVWLLGGLFMTINATFSHGGFAGPDGPLGGIKLMLLSAVPIVTFMLATYDGSLGALLLVTVVAFVVWLVQLSGVLSRFRRQTHTYKPL